MMFGWFKKKQPELPGGWLHGYKVIRANTRESSVVFNAAVTYPFGVITYPKQGNGPLAVFTNRKDAEDFSPSRIYDSVVGVDMIVSCLYQKSREFELRMNITYSNGEVEYHTRSLSTLPPGTDLASAVICLE